MRILSLLLLCGVLSVASAQQKHKPEWTDIKTNDPGVASVAPELQKIVVLCAKDSNSPEFKRAWTAYVRKHKLKGDTLDNTIRKVVNEAFRHREQFGQTQQHKKTRSANWKGDTTKTMHDTAMAVIRKIG